jgi:hypothetical protein
MGGRGASARRGTLTARMTAPVVVEGLPAADEHRAATLSACTDALKHRRCIASQDPDGDGAPPSATAIIAWPKGGDRHVRVVLERLDEHPVRRLNRDTYFAADDPVVERWRTVGLVIAAMVGESDSPSDGRAQPETRAAPEFSARAGGPGAMWIGLATLVGPGLDDGSVRLGGALQTGVSFPSSPVFLAAFLSYALRPVGGGGIDVGWTTVAIGGGARTWVSSVDLGLRIHGQVLLEYLQASSAAGGTATGGGSRLSPGVRGGVDAIWPASSALGMTLGFSLWSLSGGTAIQLDQRQVGSSRWLGYAGLLGGQWSFP